MSRTLRIRIFWTFSAFLIMLIGLIVATPHLINTQVVKNQISRQISDWMGLPVIVRGEPIVTVFPYITFKLKNVQVASRIGLDEPDLVSMEVLRAEMYWLPMLIGKFQVRRFHLDNPKFEFVRNQAGQTSWDMTGGSLISNDPDDGRLKLSDISLGRFVITNGSAHIQDHKTGWDEQLDAINLSFDWPNTGEAASLNGSVVWREQPVNYSVRSGNPMDLFGGGLSPVSLAIKSPMFEASLDGSAATMAQLQLEGDFAFETTSLRALLNWLGKPLPPGAGFGPAALKARANSVDASVSFSDMTLSLDDQRADGVIQLDFRRDRPMVQGTLASDRLDLGPYLAYFDQDRSLLDISVSAEDLLRTDLDIRLSTDNLLAAPLRFGRTAASLVTRNSQLAFSIGETYAYGGRLEASLDLHPAKSNPESMYGHLRAKANGVLAGTFARELANTEFVTGTTLVELDVEGEGQTVREMANQAAGEISLVVTEGGFEHFNLDRLETSLKNAADPLSEQATKDLYQGGTEFDVLSVRAALQGKALNLNDVRLTSGKRAIKGDARISLSDMAVDAPATLLLYDSADPATHATDEAATKLPFRLKGPLAEPVLSRPTQAQPQAPAQQETTATSQTPASDLEPALTSAPETEANDASRQPLTSPTDQAPAPVIVVEETPPTDAGQAEQSTTEKLKEAIGDAVNGLFQSDSASDGDRLTPKGDF
ncbi:AsmA family protein [Cohaesibacter intestini]|uniref:AsmA family protein n=1 Tax=Cohaesibacter intestini TaxID=2211145 RepID=UPI000DE93945|nr:AsmA family protein [Cohaesibacter intestini]